MRPGLIGFIGLILGYFGLTGTINAQDVLTRVTEYDVFPIGAMRPPDADTLEKMLGMNFNWYGFDLNNPDTDFDEHHQPHTPGGVTTITDPFYWDTTAVSKPEYPDGDYRASFYELLWHAAYGKDIRIYLPSTSGITQEYLYKWQKRLGGFHPTFTNEWWIPTDSTVTGDTILKLATPGDLGVDNPDAKKDPYTPGKFPGGYQEDYHLADHLNSYSYDFIFYLNSSALATIHDTDAVFRIEYYVKGARSNSFVKVAADTVTKGLYNNLAEAITQPANYKFKADSLSRWYDGQSLSRSYKLLNRILNLRDSFIIDGDLVSKDQCPQVDVRVITNDRIPIYVRGLRIRDWRAQRLLGGHADAALESAIDQMMEHPLSSQYKSWTLANENTYKVFHAWAYVNNLLIHSGAPPARINSRDDALLARIILDHIGYPKEERPLVNLPKELIWDGAVASGGLEYVRH